MSGELQRMHRYLAQSPFSWLLGQGRVTLVRTVAIAERQFQVEAYSIRRLAWRLRSGVESHRHRSGIFAGTFDGRCGARGSLLADV